MRLDGYPRTFVMRLRQARRIPVLVAVLDTPSEAYMSGAGFSPAAGKMIVSGSPPIGEGAVGRRDSRSDSRLSARGWRGWRGRSMDDAVLAWGARRCSGGVHRRAWREVSRSLRRSDFPRTKGREPKRPRALLSVWARGGQPAVNSGGAHNYSFFSQQSRLIPFSNERTRGGQSAPRALRRERPRTAAPVGTRASPRVAGSFVAAPPPKLGVPISNSRSIKFIRHRTDTSPWRPRSTSTPPTTRSRKSPSYSSYKKTSSGASCFGGLDRVRRPGCAHLHLREGFRRGEGWMSPTVFNELLSAVHARLDVHVSFRYRVVQKGILKG